MLILSRIYRFVHEKNRCQITLPFYRCQDLSTAKNGITAQWLGSAAIVSPPVPPKIKSWIRHWTVYSIVYWNVGKKYTTRLCLYTRHVMWATGWKTRLKLDTNPDAPRGVVLYTLVGNVISTEASPFLRIRSTSAFGIMVKRTRVDLARDVQHARKGTKL